MPAPAADDRRPIAEVAAQRRAVGEHDRRLPSGQIVFGDLLPRHAPAIEFSLHQVERRRFHPLAVHGHPVEQVLGLRLANELGHAFEIELHRDASPGRELVLRAKSVRRREWPGCK